MEYFTSYENKSTLNVEVTRVDPELSIITYKDLDLNIECFKVDPELDISVNALDSNLDVEVTIKDSIILSVYKSTEDLCIICTLIPEEEFYEVLLDVEGVIILKDGYNFNVKKDGLQS
jgi:hypothetical protein